MKPRPDTPHPETAMIILIADDRTIIREGITSLLGGGDYSLSVAGTPKEVLELAESLSPALLILGFMTTDHGRTGIELLQQLHSRWPGLPILVCAPSDDPNLRIGLKALGARGLKSSDSGGIQAQQAILSLLEGSTWFSPIDRKAKLLTVKDLRLIQGHVSGSGHKEIGKHLGISQTAVDKRLAKLRNRFGVSSTSALVVEIARVGLLHLPPESLTDRSLHIAAINEGAADGRRQTADGRS